MPYDERTASRPLPVTSHATPTRGDTFVHCFFNPVLPFGNPGSPGYSRPGGAFRKTVLLVPLLKLAGTKFAIAPFFDTVPKYGSHRRPRFNVRRSEARHES